jgi:hypothetical protein
MLGAGWADVWQDFMILIVIVAVTVAVALYIVNKKKNDLYTT